MKRILIRIFYKEKKKKMCLLLKSKYEKPRQKKMTYKMLFEKIFAKIIILDLAVYSQFSVLSKLHIQFYFLKNN